MIRLLGAETRRLLSRRVTVVCLLLVLAAVGAYQFQVADELRPPSAAELAQAQSQFEESRQDWQANHEQREQECRTDSPAGTDCSYPEPTQADYLYRQPFHEVVESSLTLTVYLTALAVFMVAGSFIGAEYSSGSISNWLTFVPRRGRVFAAKLAVIAGFGAALSLATSALTLLVAVLLARVDDQPTEALAALGATGARGCLVSVALATVGFCLALVARHTVAAVGVLLGYLFVWFVRGTVLADSTWAQRLTPWTPEANIAAIVERGHTYEVPVQQVTADGVQTEGVSHLVSLAHGLGYWAVLLGVVVALTLAVFRRRDVS